MKRTTFADWPCSVARTVDLIGDWWTPLVLREAFWGVRGSTTSSATSASGATSSPSGSGASSTRDARARPYQEHPPRHEYVLTEKGRDFFPCSPP